MTISINRVNPILPIYRAGIEMSNHREHNPKPKHFNLMNKWNLSEEERLELDYYKLKKINAINLRANLNLNGGAISLFDPEAATLSKTYNPIYQNCSRNQINEQAGGLEYTKEYWLSFRRFNDIAIVLIQPCNY